MTRRYCLSFSLIDSSSSNVSIISESSSPPSSLGSTVGICTTAGVVIPEEELEPLEFELATLLEELEAGGVSGGGGSEGGEYGHGHG